MKWHENEVLLSAIYRAEMAGARVRWSEKIKGRQFDVTIRFKQGPHNYLTVVECKSEKAKVSAEQVDAFVTKSHDINANHAVMVSTSGYQNGAIVVGSKHNVELLILEETYESLPVPDSGKPTPVAVFYEFKIFYSNGRPTKLPDDAKLQYLANQISFSDGRTTKTLNELVRPYAVYNGEFYGQIKDIQLDFKPGVIMSGPEVKNNSPTRITFKKLTTEGVITSGPLTDIQMQQNLSRKFSLRDLDGNLLCDHSILGLKLNEVKDIVPGKFYLEYPTGNFFYCNSIENDLVTWFCVESYQHGILWRLELTQKIEHANSFIRVKNKKKIAALNELLKPILQVKR